MFEPKPWSWRNGLVRALESQDRDLIEWSLSARQEWEGFEHEAYDAMTDVLKNPYGKGIDEIPAEGFAVTYGFLTAFKGTLYRIRIGLKKCESRVRVITIQKTQLSPYYEHK